MCGQARYRVVGGNARPGRGAKCWVKKHALLWRTQKSPLRHRVTLDRKAACAQRIIKKPKAVGDGAGCGGEEETLKNALWEKGDVAV